MFVKNKYVIKKLWGKGPWAFPVSGKEILIIFRLERFGLLAYRATAIGRILMHIEFVHR